MRELEDLELARGLMIDANAAAREAQRRLVTALLTAHDAGATLEQMGMALNMTPDAVGIWVRPALAARQHRRTVGR